MPAEHSKLAALGIVAGLVSCFSLAARLEPWFQSWQGSRTETPDPITTILGDARQLFANQFFVKADAYFHSGYYPSMFDNREGFNTPHVAADAGAVSEKNNAENTGWLGKPLDFIDAFSRHFYPSTHTHLDEGGAQGHQEGGEATLGESASLREILPWIKLSADLDPHRVETYTTAAYWLRQRMGKAAEAERFLREGLRENPGSPEILFELGRVADENQHDPDRAHNLYLAALKNWQQQESAKPEPDKFILVHILSHLSMLEQRQKKYDQAIEHMKLWQANEPGHEDVAKRIQEVEELRKAGRQQD